LWFSEVEPGSTHDITAAGPGRGQPHLQRLAPRAALSGERAFALLVGRWRALRHITTSPRKIGTIVKAALVLFRTRPDQLKVDEITSMGRIPVIREGREQAVASKAPPLPVTTASDGFDAPAPADLLEQVIELRRQFGSRSGRKLVHLGKCVSASVRVVGLETSLIETSPGQACGLVCWVR
jgi:hypothetical protein